MADSAYSLYRDLILWRGSPPDTTPTPPQGGWPFFFFIPTFCEPEVRARTAPRKFGMEQHNILQQRTTEIDTIEKVLAGATMTSAWSRAAVAARQTVILERPVSNDHSMAPRCLVRHRPPHHTRRHWSASGPDGGW